MRTASYNGQILRLGPLVKNLQLAAWELRVTLRGKENLLFELLNASFFIALSCPGSGGLPTFVILEPSCDFEKCVKNDNKREAWRRSRFAQNEV